MGQVPGRDAPHPSDGELVAAAQRGHGPALGLLLERHRPGLLAAALRLLGYGPDAEDAVQETCLIAMHQLGAVRDPEAVGAWLHAVLRRSCLQHHRRRRGELLADALPEVVDSRPRPDERFERLELRDWIWEALQRLPEPLRVAMMLRYFGSYESYDEVAAMLGIPIGTVRSRLSEGKQKLADALLASAGLVDEGRRADANERELLWKESIREVFRRGDSAPLVMHFARDVLVAWSNGQAVRGRRHLAAEIEQDLDSGVRLEPVRVMTGDAITVVEGRLVNPPETPDLCPPGIAFVARGRAGKASHIRLHLAPRPPRPEPE